MRGNEILAHLLGISKAKLKLYQMLQFTCGLNSETLRLFHLQGYQIYCNLNHAHTGADLILYSPYSEPR